MVRSQFLLIDYLNCFCGENWGLAKFVTPSYFGLSDIDDCFDDHVAYLYTDKILDDYPDGYMEFDVADGKLLVWNLGDAK